jgi:hypothetical protein
MEEKTREGFPGDVPFAERRRGKRVKDGEGGRGPDRIGAGKPRPYVMSAKRRICFATADSCAREREQFMRR